jgi:hypothetical protein
MECYVCEICGLNEVRTLLYVYFVANTYAMQCASVLERLYCSAIIYCRLQLHAV